MSTFRPDEKHKQDMNDGGAAFPSKSSDSPFADEGMSLRDYFAAKAMQAIIEADGIQYAHSNAKLHAKLAYEHADAMLAERDK